MTNISIRALALTMMMAIIVPSIAILERQSIEEPWPMLFQQAAVDPEVAALQNRARVNLNRLVQMANIADPMEEI